MFTPSKIILPANRQGIIIDACSILLNLFFWPVFSGRVGNLFNQPFGNNAAAFKTLAVLMLFILAGRLAGLYLKRFPLQTRRGNQPQTYFQLYFSIFNVPVFILTAAFTVMLLANLVASSGLWAINENGVPNESPALAVSGALAMFFLMCLEVYLLYRLSKPLNAHEKAQAQGHWRFGWKGELLADFGLFAYMMIWQVFHQQTVAMMMTPAPGVTETLNLKVGGAVFSLFSFLMFYLSPRTVFLIEDHRYLVTWLFILLVFLSSLARYW